MSKGPEVQVPESSGVLDFVTLKSDSLQAAAACIAWSKGTDGRTRDSFRNDLHGTLQVLAQSSELNVRVIEFAQALSQKHELPNSRPEGLEGFSLAIFRSRELSGSRSFDAHLVNFLGSTGLLLPTYPSGNIMPRKNSFTDGNGLFSVTKTTPRTEIASAYSLVFSGEPFDIYLGLRDQLEAMRASGTLTPWSNAHGSIITNRKPVSTNVGKEPELRRAFDPVYSD